MPGQDTNIENNTSNQSADSTGAQSGASVRELMSSASTDALNTGGDEKTPAQKAVAENADEAPEWAKEVHGYQAGDTPEDTVARLNARVLGLRQKVGEGEVKDLPESADKYEFDLGDKYKEAFGENADDPLLKAFGAVAHKNGMGQGQANEFIGEIVEAAFENGVIGDKPMSMDEFFEDLGGKDAGDKIIGDTTAYINNLHKTGAFGDVATDEGKVAADKLREAALDMAALSPDSMRVFDMMRKSQNAPGMALPGGGNDGGFELTLDNARKLQADPRYDSGSSKFDKGFRNKVDAMFTELDKQ